MATFFLILYNFLFIVLFLPVSVLILIFSKKYRKEFFYKLPERFASFDYQKTKPSKKTVWIHCSSLGEVRAVEPVLERLSEYNTVLTTFTKTGRDYAGKIQRADFNALLPLDIYPFMAKAFNKIKPDILILIETELWPAMLYAADKKNIKVMTVNGRMSSKSFKVYRFTKFFWKPFISLIDIIIARSGDDADRFSYLTDNKTKIYVSGNIKYDRDFSVKADRKDFGLTREDLVFTAGSTREGEEEIIADTYKKVGISRPEMYFYMAPRHLSRINSVKKILDAKKVDYVLFSSIEKGSTPPKKFVLVDVFGKLQSIYAVSDICYVGGSIVEKGGQNPIEPAASGKPVLFGKNMDNFKTEAEVLVKYGGAITVFDADDIAAKIEKLVSNKDFLSLTGQNAFSAVNSQKGAVEITARKIKEELNES